jgi:hypothetical protein
VCEPHLDLLALTSRLLKALGASERPGNVSGMLMDVARDLALWFLWAALRFELALALPQAATSCATLVGRLMHSNSNSACCRAVLRT